MYFKNYLKQDKLVYTCFIPGDEYKSYGHYFFFKSAFILIMLSEHFLYCISLSFENWISFPGLTQLLLQTWCLKTIAVYFLSQFWDHKSETKLLAGCAPSENWGRICFLSLPVLKAVHIFLIFRLFVLPCCCINPVIASVIILPPSLCVASSLCVWIKIPLFFSYKDTYDYMQGPPGPGIHLSVFQLLVFL